VPPKRRPSRRSRIQQIVFADPLRFAIQMLLDVGEFGAQKCESFAPARFGLLVVLHGVIVVQRPSGEKWEFNLEGDPPSGTSIDACYEHTSSNANTPEGIRKVGAVFQEYNSDCSGASPNAVFLSALENLLTPKRYSTRPSTFEERKQMEEPGEVPSNARCKICMKRSKHKKESRRRRVFILGAGVSASAGIAVARDILRTSVQLAESSDSAKADRVHKLLTYLYPGFEKELRNYPNIEDFLNLLEMAQKFNTEEFIASKVWSEKQLEDVKLIIVKAVTEYIWERMRDKDQQRSVDDFVRLAIRPGDTIVTFNWDLILERSLEDYPKNPSFLYTYSRKRTDDSNAV
jgi:hypothetical protein